MDDTKKAYKQVSGVDIEEQKRIWDERGKGYYGEFLVFNHLYGEIPGMCKILMNCEIPVEGNKSTEVDLILIHETGIYSFEMKHYKGDIYVNPDGNTWTQYFRTQSNEVFHNPIQQNEYHISAIKKLFPDIPVFSFVVFTNDECRLRIKGSVSDYYSFSDGELCTLEFLPDRFRSFSSKKENGLSTEKIDNVFNTLKPYSKLQNAAVKRDGETVPVLEYFSQFNQAFKNKVQGTIDDYNERKRELEEDTRNTIERCNKQVSSARVASIVAIMICIAGIVFIPKARIDLAEDRAAERISAVEKKYQEFFSKFDDANTVVKENVLTSDLVHVTDLEIRPAVGVEDSVIVSFALVGTDGDLVLGFTTETRMIVQLKSGDVKECDFYYDSLGEPGCVLRNSAWLYKLCPDGIPTVNMADILVTNVQEEDIESIKLNNIAVFSSVHSNNAIMDNAEIEVYKA